MQSRFRLTYANVVATLALFLTLAGGGAYALSKIGTTDLKRKAVTSSKLARKAVTTAKVAPGAITADRLAPDTQGAALAGAKVDEAGHVIAWFNRLGGAPTVEHSNLGVYEITWPGFTRVDFFFSVQLATVETGIGGESVAGINTTSSAPAHPRIFTRDSAGNLADRSFNYVVFGPSPDDTQAQNRLTPNNEYR